MMSSLFKSPVRIYVLMCTLAAIGVYCGLNLSVSLFPNSSKPRLWVVVPYGNMTAKGFAKNYGEKIEGQLKNISFNNLKVEKVVAQYHSSDANYDIQFRYGDSPELARNEVEKTLVRLTSGLSRETRDGLGVYFYNQNSGFIAVSFFSNERDLNDLYKILRPQILPKISEVKDAEAGLFNPNQKELQISLDPGLMAQMKLLPGDVEKSILYHMADYHAGSLRQSSKKYSLTVPSTIKNISDMGRIPIQSKEGATFYLGQMADISLVDQTTRSGIYKTSGMKSLILFADCKMGGNVKEMSEQVKKIVSDVSKDLPSDVQYKILVDPSEFIQNAVRNVFHEVALGAFLAVLILFIFIGSFKNTVTAAIEIPLSMILAFILMKLTGMNINLISLGGLALSAGMNVDASVVVMENIFRHFENVKGKLSFSERLDIIINAVREVWLPIIASTISSLVVFTPLIFTRGLTYALLGDLAKAVVFSHGFSAFVAILLVPTVRLHLLTNDKQVGADGEKGVLAFLQKGIRKLEQTYANSLEYFIKTSWPKVVVVLFIIGSLVTSIYYVFPRLKREIIGMPDTDWIIINARTHQFTKIEQMEEEMSRMEKDFLDKFGNDIQYTFSRIRSARRGRIMARLKDKKQMNELWKKFEAYYKNTPFMKYYVFPWNPAELPIPNPPHFKVKISGGVTEDQQIVGKSLEDYFDTHKIFPRIWTEPSSHYSEKIGLLPKHQDYLYLSRAGKESWPNPFEISNLVRVATQGKTIEKLYVGEEIFPIKMIYNRDYIYKEELEAFPIGMQDKIVPLKTFVDFKYIKKDPSMYRENSQKIMHLYAKQNKGKENLITESQKKGQEAVALWKKEVLPTLPLSSMPSVSVEESQVELTSAISELKVAIVISILLMLLTLIIQFGDIVAPLLILVAVPFGLIGSVLSLFIFNSTLSLNSILGMILLNGLSVANSIIIVDFLRKMVAKGLRPIEAVKIVAQKRLRPILITSLTTILGMMPIAFGYGEGGRILQPLGISVSGGLWFSTIMTLFIVPTLQVLYLERKWKKGVLKGSEEKEKEKSSDPGNWKIPQTAGVQLEKSQNSQDKEGENNLWH